MYGRRDLRQFVRLGVDGEVELMLGWQPKRECLNVRSVPIADQTPTSAIGKSTHTKQIVYLFCFEYKPKRNSRISGLILEVIEFFTINPNFIFFV